MHICFLCNEYPKEGFPHGGFGTFVKTISLQLVKAGVAVSVVGVNYEAISEHKIEDGISIFRTKKHKIKGLSWFLNARDINRCLKEIHQKSAIDIIEASELGLAFINKIPNIKYIIRLHGGHHFFAEAEKRGIDKWKGFQEKKSFRKAEGFIAVSEYVGYKTQDCLGIPFKFSTIYNCVDNIKFNLSNRDLISNKNLLFVGTVCEKKGVRQLILAMPFIKEKFPTVHLKIVGRDWYFADGKSYIQYLQTFISSDLVENISIIGGVNHEEIGALLDNAEVCVFPSHMEAMPLAWLEALSKGKSVVASDIGPGREAIIDKETGLLADPYNPIDIAEKICWMLSNKEQAQRMGLNARNRILQKFNPEIIFKENLEFYNKLQSING